MDQSAKLLPIGLLDSYKAVEISLSVTSTSRPILWPTKGNSFIGRSAWSPKLRTTLNAELRIIPGGDLSPRPHTSSGLGRLILRLLSNTSALILEASGPRCRRLGRVALRFMNVLHLAAVYSSAQQHTSSGCSLGCGGVGPPARNRLLQLRWRLRLSLSQISVETTPHGT